MARVGTRTAAALSVILSAALGYATNLLTNHWSWGLAIGALAVLAASIWLATRPATVPVAPPPARSSIRIVAKDRALISGISTHATDGAQIIATADHQGTIKDTTADATAADVTLTADNATIEHGKTTGD